MWPGCSDSIPISMLSVCINVFFFSYPDSMLIPARNAVQDKTKSLKLDRGLKKYKFMLIV